MELNYYEIVDNAQAALLASGQKKQGVGRQTSGQLVTRLRVVVKDLLSLCEDQRAQINIAQLGAVAGYPQLNTKGDYERG